MTAAALSKRISSAETISCQAWRIRSFGTRGTRSRVRITNSTIPRYLFGLTIDQTQLLIAGDKESLHSIIEDGQGSTESPRGGMLHFSSISALTISAAVHAFMHPQALQPGLSVAARRQASRREAGRIPL